MEEATKKTYCTNCGESIDEHAEICTKCGVRPGKVINYCYNCGGKVEEQQELCLSCGVNPRKMNVKGRESIKKGSQTNGEVNVTLAAFAGYFIPGLPSILWLGQKTKGIVFVIVTVLVLLILPILGNILLGVGGAIDAYQLAKRVNQGETLGPWTFFWDK